jgi:hypothetical protein
LWHTHNTMETGMILLRYGNLEPIPIPEHTCFQIHMVLPAPMSCFSWDSYKWLKQLNSSLYSCPPVISQGPHFLIPLPEPETVTLPTPKTLPSQWAKDAPTFSSTETYMREENPFTQDAPAKHVGPMCHTQDFTTLSECTCRVIVAQDEIAAEHGVIHCKRPASNCGSVIPVLKINMDLHMTSVPSSRGLEHVTSNLTSEACWSDHWGKWHWGDDVDFGPTLDLYIVISSHWLVSLAQVGLNKNLTLGVTNWQILWRVWQYPFCFLLLDTLHYNVSLDIAQCISVFLIIDRYYMIDTVDCGLWTTDCALILCFAALLRYTQLLSRTLGINSS